VDLPSKLREIARRLSQTAAAQGASLQASGSLSIGRKAWGLRQANPSTEIKPPAKGVILTAGEKRSLATAPFGGQPIRMKNQN